MGATCSSNNAKQIAQLRARSSNRTAFPDTANYQRGGTKFEYKEKLADVTFYNPSEEVLHVKLFEGGSVGESSGCFGLFRNEETSQESESKLTEARYVNEFSVGPGKSITVAVSATEDKMIEVYSQHEGMDLCVAKCSIPKQNVVLPWQSGLKGIQDQPDNTYVLPSQDEIEAVRNKIAWDGLWTRFVIIALLALIVILGIYFSSHVVPFNPQNKPSRNDTVIPQSTKPRIKPKPKPPSPSAAKAKAPPKVAPAPAPSPPKLSSDDVSSISPDFGFFQNLVPMGSSSKPKRKESKPSKPAGKPFRFGAHTMRKSVQKFTKGVGKFATGVGNVLRKRGMHLTSAAALVGATVMQFHHMRDRMEDQVEQLKTVISKEKTRAGDLQKEIEKLRASSEQLSRENMNAMEISQKEAEERAMDLREEIRSLNANLQEAQQVLREKSEESARASSEAAAKVQRLEAEIYRLQSSVSDLTEKDDNAKSEIEQKKREIMAYQQEITGIRRALHTAEASRAGFPTAPYNSRISELTNMVSGMSKELENARSIKRQLEQAIQSQTQTLYDVKNEKYTLESHISTLGHEVHSQKEEIGRLANVINEKTTALQNAEAQVQQHLQTINKLNHAKQEIEDQLRVKTMEMSQTMQNLKVAENNSRRLHQSVQDMEGRVKHLEQEVAQARGLNEAGKAEISQLMEKLAIAERMTLEAKSQYQKLAEVNQARVNELQASKNELMESKSNLQETNERIARVQALEQALEANRKELEARSHELKVTQDELQSRRNEVQANNKASIGEIQNAHREINRLKEQLALAETRALQSQTYARKVSEAGQIEISSLREKLALAERAIKERLEKLPPAEPQSPPPPPPPPQSAAVPQPQQDSQEQQQLRGGGAVATSSTTSAFRIPRWLRPWGEKAPQENRKLESLDEMKTKKQNDQNAKNSGTAAVPSASTQAKEEVKAATKPRIRGNLWSGTGPTWAQKGYGQLKTLAQSGKQLLKKGVKGVKGLAHSAESLAAKGRDQLRNPNTDKRQVIMTTMALGLLLIQTNRLMEKSHAIRGGSSGRSSEVPQQIPKSLPPQRPPQRYPESGMFASANMGDGRSAQPSTGKASPGGDFSDAWNLLFSGGDDVDRVKRKLQGGY
eukprot:CAMPEP_0184491908 /NCGR_PEP_ID=MMETSP0113_2-20130426/21682_1 /TAXON_ID=91329 /ORGANISM="Norrisiella sphaerica, Strain BC52" /LENGTH=1131 /DNA_ID=CAMNT_0026876457 /DNA_START=23 /DNA_END=3418 /DNA_ORIENTATION=+